MPLSLYRGILAIFAVFCLFFTNAQATSDMLAASNPKFENILRALGEEHNVAVREHALLSAESSSVQALKYNEPEAKAYSRFAAAAYCAPINSKYGNPGLPAWTCDACKNSGRQLTNVVPFHVELSDVNGFVGYEGKNNLVYLVFTGSQSVVNWLYNIDINLVPFTASGSPIDGRVHAGFMNAWSRSRTEVLAKLSGVVNSHPSAKIRVIGHSLGGAIAVHATLDLALSSAISVYEMDGLRIVKTGSAYDEATPFDSILMPHFTKTLSQITTSSGSDSLCSENVMFSVKTVALQAAGKLAFPMYTYGQPRVGNPSWNQWVLKTLGVSDATGAFVRVVHWKDIVPHLPPTTVCLARHLTTEVFYDEEFTSFQKCSTIDGEDPTCSNRFLLPASVSDHLEYLGYHLGVPADLSMC